MRTDGVASEAGYGFSEDDLRAALDRVDSDLPDAMHRVHMAIAECLGEEVEPQADLQNVPLDEDERQASRGPGAPAGSPDSRTA